VAKNHILSTCFPKPKKEGDHELDGSIVVSLQLRLEKDVSVRQTVWIVKALGSVSMADFLRYSLSPLQPPSSTNLCD
jgi:hypothetical protein